MALDAAGLLAVLDELLGPGSELVQGADGDLGRVGVALDPAPELVGWARTRRLDALVLHRSWGFRPPPGLAVLACHDPFDARLGLAANPWLHDRLGLRAPRALAAKAAVADAPSDVRERVRVLLGGEERHAAGVGAPVRRVALADAMTDALVRAAAGAGAQLYVTGSWRVPGEGAVRDTGIAVQVVGHRRQESWSLALLAELLTGRRMSVIAYDG
ncbi:MAG: Nif3-like dinuclear metal center hexameric protein [Actinomycetota bacterium]|nr:Nif3-like dinuclear metal center hexameric protein [Actinomycetota bacterium]